MAQLVVTPDPVEEKSSLKLFDTDAAYRQSRADSATQSLRGQTHVNERAIGAQGDRLSLFSRTMASIEAKFGQMVAKLTGEVSVLRGMVQLIGGQTVSTTNVLKAKDAAKTIELLRIGEALSGNITLYLEDLGEDITAAALNAAAATTLSREFDVTLCSEAELDGGTVRLTHPWATTPVVIAAEAAGDVGIANPTIEWRDVPADPPKFNKGVLRLKVIFDTDAGATKTYVAADTVTVEVKVTADDKLLGWTVAPVTKTYTVT